MGINDNKCPNCGSEEFISSPNRYDVLIFNEGRFTIEKSEFIDEETIYCRECNAIVDYNDSISSGKIVI